jgi:meso-butanediol dehydrogenase/(S,S)-butanediol dehydrogenase/diacetyl reductase
VCLADIDAEGVDAAAQELAEFGYKVIGVSCDVTNRASIEDAIARTATEYGPIDVFFNNAGITRARRLLDIDEDEWNRIMSVNALGVLLCTQAAARHMIERTIRGKIINTASIAGKQGFPLVAHYCASKFAVIALTQTAARELAPHGITVNAFCPGVVDTELWAIHDAEFIEAGQTSRPGQAFEEFSAGIALGRVATPEDIAGLAAFLASADADYITGQAINVDGGMLFT